MAELDLEVIADREGYRNADNLLANAPELVQRYMGQVSVGPAINEVADELHDEA